MAESLALLVPAFNAEKHLPRLLESALAQTELFQEIWVYDDASTDRTLSVAESFGARVVRGEYNKGCSWGKNILASMTDCDWIHFHDADDELKSTFSSSARSWMGQERYEVVLFSYDEVDEATGRFIATRSFDAPALETDALRYAILNQINPFCGLYKREPFLAAGGYDVDPDVLYNEDVAMHIKLAAAGLRFSADPRTEIINYRRSDSMSSGNVSKCIAAQFAVLRKTARTAPPTYWPAIGTRLWAVAGVAASIDDWRTADSCVVLAGELGQSPEPGLFKLLCSMSPSFALRTRECLIRLLKPGLRSNSGRAATRQPLLGKRRVV